MPGPTADLFAEDALQQPAGREQIGEESYVLRGYALPWIERLLPELRRVLAQSPFRQMVTPGGFTMSAALSSCGDLGWTTDATGYRYTPSIRVASSPGRPCRRPCANWPWKPRQTPASSTSARMPA